MVLCRHWGFEVSPQKKLDGLWTIRFEKEFGIAPDSFLLTGIWFVYYYSNRYIRPKPSRMLRTIQNSWHTEGQTSWCRRSFRPLRCQDSFLARHSLYDAMFLKSFTVAVMLILPTLIGMQYQTVKTIKADKSLVKHIIHLLKYVARSLSSKTIFCLLLCFFRL